MVASVETSTGEELLAAYQDSALFFLASPRGTLLAEGTSGAAWTGEVGLAPAAVAAALLRAERNDPDAPGVVVGALPFDPAAPGYLLRPQTIRRGPPLVTGAVAGPPPAPAARRYDVKATPEPAVFGDAVRTALSRLGRDGLQKVVLSRTLRIALDEPIQLRTVLRALAGRDPDGYLFAVGLPEGGTLFGNSPELLISRTGRLVIANPLAGSAPRSADPVIDRANAAALLASDKDRREHAYVVDAVAEGLRPLCRGLTVPPGPALARTGRMWHLSTVLSGQIEDPGLSALALASALHPTPAICGTPAAAARGVIAELEPFDRGFYTGSVGWVDAAGDGEWIVALRCAESYPDRLRLFAGAGIVAGSQPEAEIAETAAKFRTTLDALGIDHDL